MLMSIVQIKFQSSKREEKRGRDGIEKTKTDSKTKKTKIHLLTRSSEVFDKLL